MDPLGIRGTRLDPFTHLTNALLGKGIAAESAARMSTALARQLEGRELHVAADPPVRATVERLDDVRPPAGVGALPTSAAEMPMFTAVKGRVRDVAIGEIRLDRIDLEARGIRLGAAGDRLRVDGVDYEARITTESLHAQVAALVPDAPQLRFDNGRLEGSDGWFARWFWMEFTVRAEDKRVVVEPVAVRFRGRPLPAPKRIMQPIVRPEPRLPAPLTVEGVSVDGDDIVMAGSVAALVIPVDVTRLLTDLGTQTTRSALNVMIGEW